MLTLHSICHLLVLLETKVSSRNFSCARRNNRKELLYIKNLNSNSKSKPLKDNKKSWKSNWKMIIWKSNKESKEMKNWNNSLKNIMLRNISKIKKKPSRIELNKRRNSNVSKKDRDILMNRDKWSIRLDTWKSRLKVFFISNQNHKSDIQLQSDQNLNQLLHQDLMPKSTCLNNRTQASNQAAQRRWRPWIAHHRRKKVLITRSLRRSFKKIRF